jgi:hypothetical protein
MRSLRCRGCGSGPSTKRIRLLIVGRKRLPKADEHERFWGFVDDVTHSADTLERRLRESKYKTRTRRRRHAPAVRPAGEGVYAIALLDGQMHLAYALELPQQPSEVQRAFNIAPEAGFALSIKNPEAGAPPGVGLSEEQKPDYPERLQEEFRGRRFEREDARLSRRRIHPSWYARGPRTRLSPGASGGRARPCSPGYRPRTAHGEVTPPRKAVIRRQMAMSGRAVSAAGLPGKAGQ